MDDKPTCTLLIRDRGDYLDVVWEMLSEREETRAGNNALEILAVDSSQPKDMREEITERLLTGKYTTVVLSTDLFAHEAVREQHDGKVVGYGVAALPDGKGIEYDKFVPLKENGTPAEGIFENFVARLQKAYQ